ncbi:MAG: hypothetical protein FWD48_04200 [Oscillospiraceae bacterium]|nr:hypothetical protein [Oscillospiraceae bacterium]
METTSLYKNPILKHLHATLDEMGYKRRDIFAIMRRIEKKVQNDEASKKARTMPPLKIMGVDVPREFYDVKIADLSFSTDKMATRITNALGRSPGVEYLRDFVFKSDSIKDLIGIRNMGAGSRNEFLRVLKQAIGEE